ncbi:PDZ and LIM domain protein 1 [Elysia marginata]|uniref:PDZ and LIM domain protein 1 n=1 Tax=Elysia marginata TaxID=1093978 RepID=A0AAV4JET9_9GAST|nr:PDZ and LIM domain protein 1 [Elysia marginata]
MPSLKVNPNSVSEQCGLKAGDAILAINNYNSDAMAHDDAKDEIMKSGNHITMLVERGAVKIWKPQVTPLNELRPTELRTITTATGEDVMPVQKTSLAINKPPDAPCTIGSSHNRSAQPFGKPKAAVPNVVHAQYNSPMGLYSANNIADSFAKQTVGIQNQMQNYQDNQMMKVDDEKKNRWWTKRKNIKRREGGERGELKGTPQGRRWNGEENKVEELKEEEKVGVEGGGRRNKRRYKRAEKIK